MAQPISKKTRWVMCLLCAMLLAGACGCGGKATVKGKVSYQGRPIIYGSVVFLGPDKTARSGVIKPDGSYTVEGVPAGEVKIGVISRDPSKGRSTLWGEPAHGGKQRAAQVKNATKGWFPLPRQLEDPESSGLSCILGSGHVSYDIDLN